MWKVPEVKLGNQNFFSQSNIQYSFYFKSILKRQKVRIERK
jgi:hypothetical protein